MRLFVDEFGFVAINTALGGGPTWFSARSQSKGHCIDYFLTHRAKLPTCLDCRPAPTLELPTAFKTDHIPLLLDLVSYSCPSTASSSLVARQSNCNHIRPRKFDKDAMKCTFKLERFQWQLSFIEEKVMAIQVESVAGIDR